MKRRAFLKFSAVGGASLALGCGNDSDKHLFAPVRSGDDMVTGKPTWYASTCRECPAGCGILVKTREGRAVKIEGNPLHPLNQGRLCMRGQAALQGLYNPDRLAQPLLKEGAHHRPVSFKKALALLRERLDTAAARGKNRVRLVTETLDCALSDLFDRAVRHWRSEAALVYEPVGYQSLRAACRLLFDTDTLPDYRLEAADLIVSFGADFLETWASPVAYARRFKAAHRFEGKGKTVFIHIASHQSLTGANADQWFCCRPGTEGLVAVWLLGSLLNAGNGTAIPSTLAGVCKKICQHLNSQVVAQRTGVPRSRLEHLARTLRQARAPVILGSGGLCGRHDLDIGLEIAALLLHLLCDPRQRRIDLRHGFLPQAPTQPDALDAVFSDLSRGTADVLLMHRVNPLYALGGDNPLSRAMERSDLFVVSFSDVMDDTSRHADLVLPVSHPLASWGAYEPKVGILSLMQPALSPLDGAPHMGDVMLACAFGENKPVGSFVAHLKTFLQNRGYLSKKSDWWDALAQGGFFDRRVSGTVTKTPVVPAGSRHNAVAGMMAAVVASESERGNEKGQLTLLPGPSIRFFDGRGADKPWLCEVPDPLTQVAWQTPIRMHPVTVRRLGLSHEDQVRLETPRGSLSGPVYETEGVHPDAVVVGVGQGHRGGGRYADGQGQNPLALMPARPGGRLLSPVRVTATGLRQPLAAVDGSRVQHGRKIALHVSAKSLTAAHGAATKHPAGLGMHDFPLTLPIPEGYDPARDLYPPHDHDGYRWAMSVDLDRCIGCGACAVACYAENNVGIVGEEQVINGREMAWLRVERYLDMQDGTRHIFLPMMCQHCDNAPCESVCPVYAPHHSREGLNNQIYNRCIGTRFCSQNCPYKVRRFNWFDWARPAPMPQQLNPDVTVRSKGVMEKCSFCVQRIKAAHGKAKDENRTIGDGEVVPACVQTCPTDALTFGNLMDPQSRVRRCADDPRAYQVMGYLNTKPAVIYLKKVVQEEG